MPIRVQLTAITATAIGFVFILGWALYWGANQAAINFHEYRSAYANFERYERLSQEAYRYFKQRMDRLASGTLAPDTGTTASRLRLDAAMDALRSSAVNTTREHHSTLDELERVARFTAFLEASDYRFNEVESLRRLGHHDEAFTVLNQFSEQAIDQQFQPLIDAAIATEHQRARSIDARLEGLIQRSRWLALGVAGTAAGISLIGGYALLRRLQRSIQALMQGTNAIAAGHLAYRIELTTRDEFGHLAHDFNEMASKLEAQRNLLREHRDALETRVAERTAELRQLNLDLRRMDAERLALLSDISHELRTPITVIRGEAEVALRSKAKNPALYQEALERVVEMSKQLGVYVNDLLQQARAEQTPVAVALRKLDLTDLVARSFEDIQVLARESGLKVTLDVPAAPVWVSGDESRLRQALFILGENACRYSLAGGLVTIGLRADDQAAVLTIRDQGIGIPRSDLERIFDRHFRGYNARQWCPDGQGLGLPMAKAITAMHKGRIEVSSPRDEGTTFTITLPLADHRQLETSDARASA